MTALQAKGYACTVIDEVLDESRLADLYRSADLLCAPFRGEGFGLPILEAMACGTPVLTTAWSGPKDFVDDEFALRIPPERAVPAAPFLAEPEIADPDATMVEPSMDAAVELLAGAAREPDGLAALGEAAARRGAAMTWSTVAETLAGHAMRLAE